MSSAVCDDVIREAVMLEDMFEIKAGSLFCVDVCGSGTEMSHFGKAVNTDENGVESSR